MGTERRTKKRIPFKDDILINGKMRFKSIDIGKGGIYVYTGRSFDKNTIVNISIPFQDKNITVKGKVQHNQPGIGMGIRFIDLNDEQKAMIEELIKSITSQAVKISDAKKKILLVEDDDKTRRINKSKLFLEGFFVIEAIDGIEAIKLLDKQIPDLIILDLYMEKMDGFKVLSILKMNPKWIDIPVIVFSGRGTQDVIEKVINAGANEFLSKMLTSPSKLAATVKMVLRQSRRTD